MVEKQCAVIWHGAGREFEHRDGGDQHAWGGNGVHACPQLGSLQRASSWVDSSGVAQVGLAIENLKRRCRTHPIDITPQMIVNFP